MAVRALAKGHALRATARSVQVDTATGGAWLDRVARHCRTVMLSLGHNVHVSACPLDALWRVVHTKEAHRPGTQISCAPYGDAWVWVAFAPVWRLVLACVIGKRDQSSADVPRARVAHVTDDPLPFFTRDPLPAYQHALLTTYGAWYQPRAPRRSRRLSPLRRRPLPGLLSVQVVKSNAP
jgi:hypothetical protein